MKLGRLFYCGNCGKRRRLKGTIECKCDPRPKEKRWDYMHKKEIMNYEVNNHV